MRRTSGQIADMNFSTPSFPNTRRLRRCAQGLVLCTSGLLTAFPCQALYKVIAPDGKVTFTDRPPPTAAGDRVTPITAAGNAPAAVPLPLELRQASSKYPVTLYVTAGCEPCEAGRLLLRQRGIPYSEKQVVTADDSDALQRLSGSRTSPTLTIGAQALTGLSAEVWHSYLDSAGYPRESRLPSNYVFSAATPLTERRDAGRPLAASAAVRAAPAARITPPAPAADPANRIRF